MWIMLDVAQKRATMLESVADCCFPSFGWVNLWVMYFWVYVYRRLKGLFIFSLIALWLVSLKTCLKHYYLWPDAFFFFFFLNKSYWIMSVAPSPEFQMHTVEKLAIASAWQVGSISVVSPCNARASSWPTGTAADCAAIRVRLPGHWSNAAVGRRSRSRSTDQNGSFQEPTTTGAKWAGVVRPHLRQAWFTQLSLGGWLQIYLLIYADLYFSHSWWFHLKCANASSPYMWSDSVVIEHFLMLIYPLYGIHSINRNLFRIFYIWCIALSLTMGSMGFGLLDSVCISSHMISLSYFFSVFFYPSRARLFKKKNLMPSSCPWVTALVISSGPASTAHHSRISSR